MRRLTPVIVATVAGFGVLAAFKTTPATLNKSSAIAHVASRTPASGAAPPRSTPTTRGRASETAPTTSRSPTRATVPPTSPPTVSVTHTFVGDDVPNQYGDVQVQITVRDHQLTDIQALQLPSSHQRSQEISGAAVPILRQEALQAQSAQINLVSGATFTSESYAQSLQSALDRAGI